MWASESPAELQRAVGLRFGDQPHLAGAATHLVGVTPLGRRQRLEAAAEVDYMAVALFPVAEQLEFGVQVIQRRIDAQGGRSPFMRARSAKVVSLLRFERAPDLK